MVQFDVVADDVIHFFGCQGLGQTAEQRARAAGSHSVYEHVFLVFDQIGVVGGAVRRAGIAVKVAVIIINAATQKMSFLISTGCMSILQKVQSGKEILRH